MELLLGALVIAFLAKRQQATAGDAVAVVAPSADQSQPTAWAASQRTLDTMPSLKVPAPMVEAPVSRLTASERGTPSSPVAVAAPSIFAALPMCVTTVTSPLLYAALRQTTTRAVLRGY